MQQKFSKKELERLGCTEEEIKLVMEYQRIFPILQEDNESYIDLSNLHKSLCVSKDYTSWVKQTFEILDIKRDDYKLTYDYVGERKNVKKSIYFVKISLAKEIAMLAGTRGGHTSKELKESSKTARRFFILMEDLIKRNREWWKIRNPQRVNYKPMCDSISESIHRIFGRYGDEHDYRREADIINIIAVGSRAQSIKNYLGIGTNVITRDNLLADYNEKISFLQEQNILLLGLDMPIIQRIKMLINFFDVKYPNAKPIQDYHDRDYMIQARENLINELSN